MSNIMIGVNNKIGDATFVSGYGTRQTSLPLENLKDPVHGIVARSVDATDPSSKFKLDLGKNGLVRVVALCNHNISLTGQVRIVAFTDSTYNQLRRIRSRTTNVMSQRDASATTRGRARCVTSDERGRGGGRRATRPNAAASTLAASTNDDECLQLWAG